MLFTKVYLGTTERSRIYLGSSLYFEDAPMNPAPSVASADLQNDPTGTTSRTYTTSLISWSSGQLVDTVTSVGSSPTRDAAAGSTNDTASLVASVTNTPKLYLDAWTIVSGALDTTFNFTFSATSRSTIAGIVYSGAVGRSAITTGTGTASPFTAPAFTVTGGPRNILAMAALNVLGAHQTNPPIVPSGYTLVDQVVNCTGNNSPTLTGRSTLIVAYKVIDSTSLTWTGDTATVPAASFTGLADHTSQRWNTMSWGMYS